MVPGTPSPGGAGPEVELSPEYDFSASATTLASIEPGAEASPETRPDSPDSAASLLSSSRSSATTSTSFTTSSSATSSASKAKSRLLESALRTATTLKEQKSVGRKAADPRSKSAPAKKGLKPQHGKSPRKSVLGHQEVVKCHHEMSEHLDDKPDLDNNLHFCFWAKDIFKVLYELFRYPDASGKYIRCRAVPVEEFIAYIGRYGFDGDRVSIVREIYKCAPRHVVDSLNTTSPGAPAYEITMPMLQKFIRSNEHLTAGLEWAPVNEFKKALLETRGCFLRAWRLDVDIFNTGTVPYMTFIQACHRLQHGHHSQAIWNAFRPDSTTAPLELAEFAPEEAANLEAFIQVLWVSCAFNMYKAWERIDVNERLWVSELEFTQGAKELGFDGDASLIFRGLDTYGLGRLWRRELEYLKTLFNASSRTPHGTPQMRVLRAWTTEQFNGADQFLQRLGMEEGSTVKLSPEQFASGLIQLGYPGDAAEAAHLVARAAGISEGISRELLHPLVAGERPAAPPYIQRTIKSLKATSQTPKKKARSVTPTPAEREKAWNASVDDLCERNENRPACHRYYFGYCPPLRGPANGDGAPRTPRKTEQKSASPPATKSTNMRVSFKVEPPHSEDEINGKQKKDKKDKKDKKEKKEKKIDEDEGKEEKKEKKTKKDKKEKKAKKDKDNSEGEEEQPYVDGFQEVEDSENDNLQMGEEQTF